MKSDAHILGEDRAALGGAGISLAEPKDFFQLMKPRVMSLVVFTAIIGLLVAPGNLPLYNSCLLYTSPSPRDGLLSRMPSSA